MLTLRMSRGFSLGALVSAGVGANALSRLGSMPVSCASGFTVSKASRSGRQPSTALGSLWHICFWLRVRELSSSKYEAIRSTVVSSVGAQRSEPRTEYWSRSSTSSPVWMFSV